MGGMRLAGFLELVGGHPDPNPESGNQIPDHLADTRRGTQGPRPLVWAGRGAGVWRSCRGGLIRAVLRAHGAPPTCRRMAAASCKFAIGLPRFHLQTIQVPLLSEWRQ